MSYKLVSFKPNTKLINPKYKIGQNVRWINAYGVDLGIRKIVNIDDYGYYLTDQDAPWAFINESYLSDVAHLELPFCQSIDHMIEEWVKLCTNYKFEFNYNCEYVIAIAQLTEDNDMNLFVIDIREPVIDIMKNEWNTWFLEYGEGDLESYKEFLYDYMWKFN